MKTTLSHICFLCFTGVSCALLPRVDGRTNEISFADRVNQAYVFHDPLVWIGPVDPPEAESKALFDALETIRHEGTDQGLQTLEKFSQSFPLSSWAPSLRAHLAKYYREHGRY